jgi:hypothetical protein
LARCKERRDRSGSGFLLVGTPRRADCSSRCN